MNTVKTIFNNFSFADGSDVNFIFKNENRCINLIGNPESRSEMFNSKQFCEMLNEFGNKEVAEWNITLGSFNTIMIYIMTK